MLDASKGFLKDGNKNRLRAQDIHKIVDVFTRQTELPRYSRMVPVTEIADSANDYNLNIPRHIDSSEPEDLHDLDAHLNGGIPNRDIDALSSWWEHFPSLRKALFKRNRKRYSKTRVDSRQVNTILGNAISRHTGWVEAANPRGVVEDKERKIKETPDLTIKRKKYKMDLIPPALVVARYFAAEQAHVEDLQATREAAVRELDEFVEEHSSSVAGEEGLLADVIDDKGSVAKTSVKARLKAIRDEDANDSDEECDALTRCLDLIEAESKAASAVNEARAALDHKVLAHYAVLTEAGIKTLVVEDKWFADIRTAIEHQVQGLTQQLAGRVKELEERYARPLHELKRDVENYSARAEHHLNRMGLSL